MSRLDSTSWSLIQRASAGNPADREQFARRYDPVVRAYFCARWRLPFEHGEILDATQEVFVECFRQDGALERVDPTRGSDFRSYLYGVARLVALGKERRLRQRPKTTQAVSAIRLEALHNSSVTLSRAFDRAWAKMVLLEAGDLARRLAAGHASRALGLRALQMRFDDGLPARDIAAHLQIDVKQVYELLRRAKQDFRAALVEVMAGHHPEEGEEAVEARCVDLIAHL